jgi:hypothetical protein
LWGSRLDMHKVTRPPSSSTPCWVYRAQDVYTVLRTIIKDSRLASVRDVAGSLAWVCEWGSASWYGLHAYPAWVWKWWA